MIRRTKNSDSEGTACELIGYEGVMSNSTAEVVFKI